MIFGRFITLRRVGAGGMGVVYQAYDRDTGARVAVKVLERADESLGLRFAREVRVLATLNHPAIVSYRSHGVAADGRPYLVMDWLEGMDLRERLARGPLEVGAVLALGARMAEALAFAHARGVLHRDFKPSNVFLPDGAIERAMLIDFGVARILEDDTRLTAGGALVGTPKYMSPEQVRGTRDLDRRSDLFSLGAVLFECLAGRPPHEGPSLQAIMAKRLFEEAPRLASLRPGLAPALDDLVAELLAIDAERRPADAAEVAEALIALAAGQQPERRRKGPSTRAPALGGEERRLACVVLSIAENPDDMRGRGDETQTHVGTLGTAVVGSAEAEVAILARRHDARVERLRDGSFAAVVTAIPGATAKELGIRGARLALALREQAGAARLAVTMGTAVLSQALALDALIDAAAQLAAGPVLPVDTSVRVDAVLASLIGDRYELGQDARGTILLGERARADHEARALLGKRTPFVGRGREKRQLGRAMQAALDGEGARALVVLGPSGIGKSRLVAEVVRAYDREDLSIWIGRGDPWRQATPFGLLAPMLRAAAGIPGDVSATEASVRLEALARGMEARERGRVVEFLGDLCGVPLSAVASAQLRAARDSPMLLADQVQRAWEDLVLAVTLTSPLVIVLEDLQWSDASSLKLADAALRVAHDRRLVIVATTRPSGTEAPFVDRRVTRIHLGELTGPASERLAAAALGERATRAQITRLATQGAGNPLYLEELIRAMAEHGEDAAELPGTVKAMALARFEALEVSARRALRAGSVFGKSFSPHGVAALLGDEATGLDDLLARLCKREWLSLVLPPPSAPEPVDSTTETALGACAWAEERQYRFRHDVLREAAYAALTETDRRLGHRLAGEWLERHGERNAGVLATHFERAGERARAGLHHALAAEQALAASDLGAALDHAAHAAACGARGAQLGELRLVEAVAHHWRAAHAAEHRAALEALRLLPPLSAAWYRAVEEVAEASLPLSDVDTLVALAEALEEAPALLRDGSSPRTAFRTAAATLTMQLALAGRRDVAALVMARLEASLDDGEPPPPLARARSEFARATLAMIDGDLGRVIEHARAAVGAFEEAGDLRDAALMRSNLAWALAELGAWADAEAELRAAAALAERMGLAFVLGAAWNNLGLVLARRGQLVEARAVEEESARFYRGIGNRRCEGQSLIYLAMIHLLAGDADAAERDARAAALALASIRPTHAHALAQLAQILLARGQPAEATRAAAEAAAILDELGGIDEGETLVRLLRAETLALAGDAAAARAALVAAKQRLLERAARISNEAWRDSFLRGVPENARTLALAAELNV